MAHGAERHTKREEGASRRRLAILDAAYAEFLEKGFAATRIEDVARRAGVAKGTIYLNFPDKQALFEEMVRAVLRPQRDEIEALAAAPRTSIRDFLDKTLKDAAGLPASRQGDVMRLLVSEGLRFPNVAEFYYREIIQPMAALQRRDLERAAAAGELAIPSLAEFPQLLEAPMLLAIVWQGLFARFETLDVEKMLRAYIDCLFPDPAKR